jgi:hypothetical protein
MKMIFTMIAVVIFALSFGIAYADIGTHNGVTDFTGKTYDSPELAPGASFMSGAIEGSAAGSMRVERSSSQLSNGGNHYDTLYGGQPVADSQAIEAPRTNWAGKESSVRNYDTFEIR